jgi:hypothetical protein
MRTIARPKGWVKADAVRVVRNGGKLMVEIRRKKKRKANPPRKRKPARKKRATPSRAAKRKSTTKRKTKGKR